MIWDELAKTYAASREVSADKQIEWPAQLRMVGGVRGLDVLDVGCGTGEKARYFAEHGARSVVGLDPSTGFAEGWADHAACANLRMVQAGFENLATLPELSGRLFDRVVCFQALMYARNIRQTLSDIAALMKSGGALILSVPHPFRFALLKSELDDWEPGAAYQYTAPYRYPSPWKPDLYLEHAMPRVSDYLNALTDAGLRLVQCDEPAVTDEVRSIAPEKAAWMDRYVGILICRAEKD
jgi:SAM-dependent methyltransferase